MLMSPNGDRWSAMATIFSISYDERLLRSRELLLRRMGHRVISAQGFVEAVELCDKDPKVFDLVILGHSIPHEEKRAIARHCRRTRRCPVLALTLLNEPLIPEADHSIDPSDTGVFVRTVQQLTRTEVK
jgi:CheY-like chemotaxis protein